MAGQPILLDETHRLDGFDSGRPSLDRFLVDRALFNQAEGHSRTFVIIDDDTRVIGYHSLAAGMIVRNRAPRSVGGHGAPSDIPVALLARLAVDRRHQGKGLGAALLRHALLAVLASSQTVGFRAVMVHALDAEAEGFYRHFGFRPAKDPENVLERTLLLPLKEIIAARDQAG